MGHTPLPPPPWLLTLDQQIATLERDLPKRRSKLRPRRRRAYDACARLIVLREHVLFGWHDVIHAGQKPAPPPPAHPVTPTYRLR